MFAFFKNPSIFKKILLGFVVVGAMSVLLGLFALANLSRIRETTDVLMPRIAGSEYLRQVEIALDDLEGDIERYTTVGGEESKEVIENRLEAVVRNTDSLYNITAPEVAALINDLRANIERLQESITEFIALQEQFEKKGINRQIVVVFDELETLRSKYQDVRKKRDDIFTSALDEQSELIRRSVLQVTAFEIAIILAILAFSYLLARAITFPIIALRNIVSTTSRGHYDIRAPVRDNDEIGELAVAFNTMAANLQAYTTELEQKITERTAELRQKVTELDESNQLLGAREAELTLANNRLRELDKVKSEFISVAAHQLRTPLSALKWILGILIDENSENLTPEQKSLLFKGFESNERMISLINEMLIVTRLESGKVRYTFAPSHIEDLIESTILDFSIQAHVRHIQLAFQKQDERIPFIKADPEKIRNVLQNLIENALRYSRDGGSITVSAKSSNAAVTVWVKDTGIGIPEKQKASIFNKFFRADNAIKHQTDGSGLGLFIAKAIVETHGGQMWFESTEGTGSTFFFTIPISTDTSPE